MVLEPGQVGVDLLKNDHIAVNGWGSGAHRSPLRW
jgi:hypothetical protein